MKKFIFAFLTLTWALNILAQPTLNSDIVFSIGDSSPVQFFTQGQNVFNPGPNGPDVTWDFSGVSTLGNEFTWAATDPANTPWNTDFPTADLAFDFPMDSIRDIRYYQFDGSKLEFLGFVTETLGGTKDTFRYDFQSNPQLEIQFPFTYQDEVTDMASGTASLKVGGVPFVVDRTINRTITADAYGTLITPAGTFNEVLRIHVTEEIEDKTFGQTTGTQNNSRYYWYSPTEKYLLLQMDSLVVQNAGGNFPSTSMFYRTGPVTTALDGTNDLESTVRLYPNPAKDFLNISFQESDYHSCSVKIISLTGKVLQKEELILPHHASSVRLQTESLSPGIYFLLIESPRGSLSKRFSIQ